MLKCSYVSSVVRGVLSACVLFYQILSLGSVTEVSSSRPPARQLRVPLLYHRDQYLSCSNPLNALVLPSRLHPSPDNQWAHSRDVRSQMARCSACLPRHKEHPSPHYPNLLLRPSGRYRDTRSPITRYTEADATVSLFNRSLLSFGGREERDASSSSSSGSTSSLQSRLLRYQIRCGMPCSGCGLLSVSS